MSRALQCVVWCVLGGALLLGGAWADELELEVRSGRVLKMLREMVNQTAAESLNLPANATSIRENITDTFSCENRTYGYYADVDNECQLFHVCLPTHTPAGRNVTLRYSFICPAETVFNQEVLVCTRPRDSIPCEESTNYYDVNMEFGKINKEEDKEKVTKETESVPVKNQNRPIRRKQNIIQELMKDALEQMEEIEEIPEEKSDNVIAPDNIIAPENFYAPYATVAVPAPIPDSYSREVDDANSRLGTERYLRSGRTLFRGTKRYRPEQ